MQPVRTVRALAILPVACIAIALSTGCGGESAQSTPVAVRDIHSVDKGSFDMLLPVSGELAAQQQVEVRNKLETRAIVTEIVPEGTQVARGDVLVRLAQEEIIDRIKDARDKVNTAQSSAVAAQQSLAIKEGERSSELAKADVTVRIAELALQGWLEGEVVNKRQQLELANETAAINLARLKDRFVESDKLVKQGFIAKDEFERDRIAMIEAEAKVKQAALDLEVYEKYQFFQDEAKKRSDLDQARAERSRVEEKFDAELVKSRADVASAEFQLQSAKERLVNLETQLSNTTLVAPIDGLVVYATSIDSSNGGRGGGDAQPPQVGTELRPNELVMILPDVSRMIANLKVSEALSGRIRQGQRVTVYSDAMPNTAIAGEVTGVSVLAATGGWRDPNRREYTVKVALDTKPELGLKPAMRCKAEILLGRVEGVVNIPVQAVFRQGPVAYVYVEATGGFAQRQVSLGQASETQIEVVSGVTPGERVLLREPKPFEVVSKLDPAVFELAAAAPPNFSGAGAGAAEGAPAGEARPRRGRPDGAGAGGPPAGRGRPAGAGEAAPAGTPTAAKDAPTAQPATAAPAPAEAAPAAAVSAPN
ncbi:MAG: HlyD family efflux transporter periplasmic adaptor subunit [Phycisphaera sp.]|nr:HlyD family efflux transporter periplasmic adaptor subunit [Phycisphaera sp.]